MIRNLRRSTLAKNILMSFQTLISGKTAHTSLILDYNNACIGNGMLQSRSRNQNAVTLSWIRH